MSEANFYVFNGKPGFALDKAIEFTYKNQKIDLKQSFVIFRWICMKSSVKFYTNCPTTNIGQSTPNSCAYPFVFTKVPHCHSTYITNITNSCKNLHLLIIILNIIELRDDVKYSRSEICTKMQLVRSIFAIVV